MPMPPNPLLALDATDPSYASASVADAPPADQAGSELPHVTTEARLLEVITVALRRVVGEVLADSAHPAGDANLAGLIDGAARQALADLGYRHEPAAPPAAPTVSAAPAAPPAHPEWEPGPDERVPANVPPRATKAQLWAIADSLEIQVPECSKEVLRELIAETAAERAEIAINAAHEAGMAAALAVPPGRLCGRGSVAIHGPLAALQLRRRLESPFGQDVDRHEAYVATVVRVLRRYGVSAAGGTSLD